MASRAEPVQPEAVHPENTGRKPDGTFAKGNSINPAGRPKGARNRSTMAALAIMEADAETISRKGVVMTPRDLFALVYRVGHSTSARRARF
jgi:hypothetical protein